MKKQTNPSIKAHLLRSAFYLLLLLGTCAIPLALAQPNAVKQTNPRYRDSSSTTNNVQVTFAPANTITVTSTADSGFGTLRQALADALNGDTINFDLPIGFHTIILSTGELLVNKNITISGP